MSDYDPSKTLNASDSQLFRSVKRRLWRKSKAWIIAHGLALWGAGSFFVSKGCEQVRKRDAEDRAQRIELVRQRIVMTSIIEKLQELDAGWKPDDPQPIIDLMNQAEGPVDFGGGN